MKAATSQKTIKSRHGVDACKRHHDCFKEGSKNFFFSFTLQKRLWKVPKADNAASVSREGDGPDR